MKIGTVKWFNLQKGYGFIHPDDGSPNILVHRSAIESAGMGEKAGQRVIFEIQRDERTGDASAVSVRSYVFAATPNLNRGFTPRIRSISFPHSSHRQCRRACGCEASPPVFGHRLVVRIAVIERARAAMRRGAP
jgi:cold shock protein